MDEPTSTAPSTPPRSTAAIPSGRGTAWWSEGWRLFAAAPGPWIAITVIFVLLTVLVASIPVIGSIATTLLSPVFAGGVLLGCRALDRGGALTVGHLFASFSDRLTPLLIVGALYLVGTAVIAMLVFAGLVGSIGMAGMSALLEGDPLDAGIEILASLGVGAILTLLIVALVGIPLTMSYWFAPALVVFRNDEPIAAMKASFHACLVNTMPMLVYSLLGLVLAIVASIPFGLGWLVLAPVFAASVYASYKEIFGSPD